MYEDLKKFWKEYPDIDEYTNRNMLDNIITIFTNIQIKNKNSKLFLEFLEL